LTFGTSSGSNFFTFRYVDAQLMKFKIVRNYNKIENEKKRKYISCHFSKEQALSS